MEFSILHEFPPAHLEGAWRDCLTRVECPSHYNAPEFFLEPFWTGRGPFAVLALEGAAVTGVLTGLHESDRVNAGLPSRPQICVDVTSDSAEVLDVLARGLLEEAGLTELVSVYTWPSLTLEPFERFGFRRRPLQGDVVLDLTQGPDAVFKQFAPERRRNIRFAIKQGIEVAPAGNSEIPEAYATYRQWRRSRRKKIVGEEISFPIFQEMCRLTANRRLYLARHSGQVVAVNTFRFFPQGLVEASDNCSLDEFLHLKPNDLLQWRGIEWASREGFLRHSLGGSHLFLRRFGGVIVPVLRYRLDRTWLRRHDRKETIRDIGRAALSRMPPAVDKAARRLLGREKQVGW